MLKKYHLFGLSISIFFTMGSAVGATSEACKKAISAAKEGTLEVTLNGYLRDIHKDSHSTCFVTERGKVFETSDKSTAQGIEMIRIRDTSSDVYKWIRADWLDQVNKNRATLKGDYFKNIHTDSFSECFKITPQKRFQITNSRMAQGLFMIEIRDTNSDIYMWMPIERLELVDPKLASLCDAPKTMIEEPKKH